MSLHITFFHGWSYNADFFKDFSVSLEQSADFFDRGYYYQPHIPILDQSKKNIAVTHSMGLFYILEHYDYHDFDKIIILSGFADFCADRSKDIVVNLKTALEKNPQKALRRFSLMSGDKKRPIDDAAIDVSLLSDDLDILMERNIYDALIPHQDKIYAVHGASDSVIPHENSHIPHIKNMIVADAGHVYSDQDNQKILGVIKSWIME